MAAPGVDEREHAAAVVALLSAPLGGHLYEYGNVPGAKGVDGSTLAGSLPNDYTIFQVERDPALIVRTSGRADSSAWAVTFRSSSRTVNNVRNTQRIITQTIEGVRLIVGAVESTPVEFESDVDTEPDNSRFSGSLVFTYVL